MPNDLILLVDDEPSILKLGRMYLEREGFRVEEARDGEAALRAVESSRTGADRAGRHATEARRLRGLPQAAGIWRTTWRS